MSTFELRWLHYEETFCGQGVSRSKLQYRYHLKELEHLHLGMRWSAWIDVEHTYER